MLGNFFKKGEEEDKSYLALVITPDRVLATIWTFENEQIKTLGFGHKSFSNEDVLIHQAAIAIDSAGEQAKVNISKTVFGLAEQFLEDGSLTRQTTKILKKLASELELNPQAFVPIAAGINHLLKVEESITPHAVLVGVFGTTCEVHLLESEKIIQSKTSPAPINIEKLENLIGSLKEENRELPSRIVVYGIGETTELAEKIKKSEWQNIFVHAPKVDFLDEAELARSVAYSQAADVLGYDPEVKGKVVEGNQPTNQFGFVEGEDILLSEAKKELPPNEQEAKEVSNVAPVLQASRSEPVQKASPEEYAVDVGYTTPPQLKTHSPRKSPLSFLSILDPTKLLKFDPASLFGKKIFIAIGILVILLVAGAFVFGQTITQAEIAIKVNGQQFNKNFQAKVIDGATYSRDDAIIGGHKVAGIASGSQKAVTTGSKKIGESAKGQVTVYNWTNSQKSFKKGTGIITKSGIKFALDGDVEVASRSASTPGQADTNVVALDLGPSGNLEAGQDFNFQEFDELAYSAINSANFSGGSERQATVVVQEDLEKLSKSLTETLTQKAKEDLKNLAGGNKFQDESLQININKKQFDKKVDEEAALVNLDMDIEATAIVYNEDDLKKLLAEIFSSETPPNLEIRPENINLEDLQINTKGDTLNLSGKIKAQMVPKFNEDELKGQLMGKSTKEVRSKIKEIAGVSDVQVNFKPNIPLVVSIPRNKNKITFKIETN